MGLSLKRGKEMDVTPLISIIIPLYNAEKYIPETIQSVLNQTYKNWELIIVDDGSTDNSANIVKSYIDEDTRIKYYHKKNTGVSETRNQGIKLAKGDYIAFLDADDVWEKNNLELKLDCLKSDHSLMWVFSNMTTIDNESNPLGSAPAGHDNNILDSILYWDREVIPGPCSNIILKKECLVDGLKFDRSFSTAADQDFTLYLAKNYNGKHIPLELWKYRIHQNNMSSNISVMEKDHIGVFKKAKKNNLFKTWCFKQKCFSKLYLTLAGSWWKNGNNKVKGFYYLFLSLATFPPIFISLLKKLNKH